MEPGTKANSTNLRKIYAGRVFSNKYFLEMSEFPCKYINNIIFKNYNNLS